MVPCCHSQMHLSCFLSKYDSVLYWQSHVFSCWHCKSKTQTIYVVSRDDVIRHSFPVYDKNDVDSLKKFKCFISALNKSLHKKKGPPLQGTPTLLTGSTGVLDFPVSHTFWDKQKRDCLDLLRNRKSCNKGHPRDEDIVNGFLDALRYGIANDHTHEWDQHFQQQAEDPKVEPLALLKMLYSKSNNQKECLYQRSLECLCPEMWVDGDIVSAYVCVLIYVAKKKAMHTEFFAVKSLHSDYLINVVPGQVLEEVSCGNGKLFKDVYLQYKRIRRPINIGYSHWVLAIMEPDHDNNGADVVFYNSLGNAYQDVYSKFLNGLHTVISIEVINYRFLSCPIQSDGTMCGVCTCRNLQEVMMMKGPLKEIKYSVNAMDQFHHIILSRIMNHPQG